MRNRTRADTERETMTKVLLYGVIGCCAAGIVGLAAWIASPRAPRGPARAIPAAQAEESGTLARVRAELSAERAGTARRMNDVLAELAELRERVPEAGGAEASKHPVARPVLTREERTRRSDARWNAMSESLATRLEGEPVDQNWSRAQTGVIQSLFDDPSAVGNTLESVECRSTLCRLVVNYANDEARTALETLLTLGPLKGGNLTRSGQRPGQMVAYVYREGEYQNIRAAMRTAADLAAP
jgi:hypothetical protein